MYISLSAPTLPLLPPPPHPPIPWSPLPVRVPGEAGEGERGGGGGLEVAQCLPFQFAGGGAGLIASFLPSKPNWDVLGCETRHVCWKSKGEKGGGGGPIRISAGLLCWYLFLVVSFFFFLLLWARFAGADCDFLLVLGYVSVGVYLQSQRDLFLKPKVRGLAVARLLSVCGGLPASACLDFCPSRGQDICPNLPRGC